MKLQDLPRNVRDAVERIEDREVDTQPEIKALLVRIEEADAACRPHIAQTQALRAKLAALDSAVSEAQRQIEQIREGRPVLGLRILLGEATDSEDKAQQAQLTELARSIELMTLARPLLEDKIQRSGRVAERSALAATDLRIELEQSRLAAKVELASARV